MENNSISKIGRIITGLGVGSIVGICCAGKQAIEEFSFVIFLGILAIIVGMSIVFYIKNKEKVEQLNIPDSNNGRKTCPNCGLPVANDCKQCPKCKTIL